MYDMPQISYRIVVSLRRAVRMFLSTVRQEATRIGVTEAQLIAMYILYRRPGIGLNELAEGTQLTNSTMSGVVERLVRSGMITRQRSEEDRRLIYLRLTPEGEAKLQEALHPSTEFAKRMQQMAELPKQDIDHLLRILDKIIQILEPESQQVNSK